MTQAEIIEAAHTRTGRRAEEIAGLDFSLMLLTVIQEFCGEHRWYWRKKRFSFSSVAGTATYDLTDTSGANVQDLDELISLWRIDSTTARGLLDPLTDEECQIAAIDDTTTGDPSHYFWEHGTDTTVRLTVIPNAAKTYRGLYFATPSASDSGSGAVPLVPARLHYLLIKRMEMAIWAVMPEEGQGGTNYQRATAEYQYGLANAIKRDRFSTKEGRQWVVSGEAVRST